LNKGVQNANQLGNQIELCELYNLLAETYAFKKEYKLANDYLKKNKKLSASVLSDKNFALITSIQTRYETALKEKENKTLKELGKEQKNQLNKKNWLLLAFSLALLLALLSGFLMYSLLTSRRKKIALESAAHHAELSKQLVELKIKALQSQMNPHFIFNSLTSISSYILKNDQRKASDYLTKFAKLMRKIIDASKASVIRLEEEVKMLELYIELEQLRLDYTFDYKLELSESIDKYNYIPSMIIQPFVENAIWHGLQSKQEGKGLLSIRFEKSTTKETYIICIIEDNGIGRSENNNNDNENVNERLAQISNSITTTVHTIDLVNMAKKPSGTRVTIDIPLSTNNL
jgi:hypothetical protein